MCALCTCTRSTSAITNVSPVVKCLENNYSYYIPGILFDSDLKREEIFLVHFLFFVDGYCSICNGKVFHSSSSGM